MRSELEDRAAQLGLADRVIFRPGIPTSQVPRDSSQLDVMVLPSLTRPNWKEQFGRTLAESMSCETPVIGSDSGEIPYVIGDAGMIFHEGDPHALAACVQRLLEDPALYADLARRGRRRVQERYTHVRSPGRPIRCTAKSVNEDDPYQDITEWYDLEHDALTDDLECYLELLRSPLDAGGTGSSGRQLSVLEVGSGTGRIAVALASAGYEVTGVEPSPAMRRRAQARLAQLPERVARRIHIVSGAADDYGEAVTPERRYHGVLYGLNTFAHLTDFRARQRALAVAVIDVGGLLLIDLDLAGPRRLLASPGQLYLQGSWMLPPESGRWISHLVSGVMGAEPGTMVVTHWYDVFRSGDEVRRTVAQMPMALISRGELELAVASCGFDTLAVYGGFDLAPVDDLSARAILLARARRD